MKGVVIIGGGQGGARAAMDLRTAGYREPIVILTGEKHIPYERPPLSKEVLVHGAAIGEPHVVPEQALKDNDIGLHLDDVVTGIDPAAKQVHTAVGRQYGYDHLIVATGASARRVPIPGSDLDGVLTLRDACDATLLRERLVHAKRIGVIGGGVLGLEIAASARALGIDVVVLEQGKNCLERMLPPDAVAPIMALHREKGARILCDVRIERILGLAGKVAGVALVEGGTIDCDLVIMATGSVPNDGLVSAAGGECKGGVLVDEHCRTSLPDVFAVGDVAVDRSTGLRKESWDNANRQAAIVAAVIAGASAPAQVPAWFWSDQYEMNLQVLGDPRSGDLLVERVGGNGRQRVQFYLRDGAVAGAVLFDSGRDRRVLAQLIGRRVDINALAASDVPFKQLLS